MFDRVDKAVELASMEGSKENPLNMKDNLEYSVNLDFDQKINKKEIVLDPSGNQALDYTKGNWSSQKIDCSDIEELRNKVHENQKEELKCKEHENQKEELKCKEEKSDNIGCDFYFKTIKVKVNCKDHEMRNLYVRTKQSNVTNAVILLN